MNRQSQQELQAANDRALVAENKRKHNDETNDQTVKDYQLNLAALKELNDKLQTEKNNPRNNARIRTIYIKDKSGQTLCSGDGYVDPEFARLWNVRLESEQAGRAGGVPDAAASVAVRSSKADAVGLKQ